MKRAKVSAIVAALIWLDGCASTNVIINSSAVTPMTHQPERGSVSRTVGLLRRLVILPARIEFSPSDPKRCFDTCDWDRLRLEVAQKVPSYLAEWRGYEVVVLDPLLPDHASVEVPTASLDDFAGQLAAFAEQLSSEPPSEQLANAVREIANRLWVDGIVVIRGSVAVTSWAEAGLGLALAASGYGLLAALPIQMVRIGSKFEAYIFETGAGRLVWASVHSSSGNPFAQPPSANNVITELLDPIEPALPAVMTRAIKPPQE
ncbi:MAG TPA: hypothetical protein VMO00_20345 [Methylomirabilota bacterium]|nr:hypothetical protein [Methylomirabilota bacterium]